MALPHALLVAPSTDLAEAAVASLTGGGFRVTLVTSFHAARAHLAERPSLLISEVQLGDYNGLHLAIYAKHQNTPAIVIGDPDLVLTRDAKALGARYLSRPLNGADILTVAAHSLPPDDGSASPVADVCSDVSFFGPNDIDRVASSPGHSFFPKQTRPTHS